MDAGTRRTRRRLLAGLAVLGAVWAFAAFSTGGDAARLFRAQAIGDSLGQPADAVILELQVERALSTSWLGGSARRPADGRQAALAAQRSRTDAAVARLHRSASGTWARWAAGANARQRVDALTDRLRSLPALRDRVDGYRITRGQVVTEYGGLVDAAFEIYGAPRVRTQREESLVASARAREVLAREDALVRGGLAAGGLTDAERGQLGQLVAVQRFLHAEARSAFTPPDLARYQRLTAGPRFAALRALEDKLVATPAASSRTTEADWAGPADAVLAGLRELTQSGAREAIDDATPAGVGTIVLAGMVGGLGLIAVIAVFVVGLRSARALGSSAAPAARSPVGSAPVDADPAAAAGAQQGPDRELYSLLLDLNRRNQALLHRQLRVLDSMERREADDEDLGDLFRADHLATRVRRNVEKLIALTGGAPGRRWRRPVPMVDVVRAAAAEVAEYPRIATSDVLPAYLDGMAVTDVSHLLAELLENATAFSPAQTRIRVDGFRCDDGYALTVTDSGPGMPEDDLATAHEVINDPNPPAGGAWWGLYAVGRLAHRHGITVTLRDGPTGGLIANVLLPAALVTWPEADPAGSPATAVGSGAFGGTAEGVPARGGPARGGPARGGPADGPGQGSPVQGAPSGGGPPGGPDPGAPDPGAPDPGAGAPAAEQPTQGGPAAEQPTQGGPAAEQPTQGGPAVEQPAEGGSGTDEPDTGQIPRTASGLPARVRNVTIPPPARTPRSDRSRSDIETDRVARLRGRFEAAAETMELPVTPGVPDPTGSDQQSTVGQPGRKSS